VLARQTATLYEQDFESGTALGIFDQYGNWSVSTDSTGNHIFCPEISQDWQSFKFGSDTWTDYGVEARVEFLDEYVNQSVEVYSRINSSMDGYRATLNQGWAGLSYYPPATSLGGSSIGTGANTWYTLRLEAAGSHIKFFIDDQPIVDRLDSQSLSGSAGFGVGPDTRTCVDDIRIWQLTPDGQIVDSSPLAKYEGPDDLAFLGEEGPLAPIPNPATAGYTYRPGDAKPIVTWDENYQVPAGANVTFDNKIIIVQPKERKDIHVFGTLTITNSLLIWQEPDDGYSWLRIEKGGVLIIKDSYSFRGGHDVASWDYEDGSTVKLDHFVGDAWTTIRGSVNYSAINYSTVDLTLLDVTHDAKVQVSNAHSVWFEIMPPAGTYTFTLPVKRQWADWTISNLWPKTTVEVHDSYIYERDIDLIPNSHVTVQDTPSGFGSGWSIYKDGPPYVTCELRNVGQPGTGNEEPKYYADVTWNLPCINSSLTLKNSGFERMWPHTWGFVHLKVYNSNLADTGSASNSTEEVYNSSIENISCYAGGHVYVENAQVPDFIDVTDAGSVVYGYGVTGTYQLLQSNGGAYVTLDKPGPPW
jgi:hypothetical protein